MFVHPQGGGHGLNLQGGGNTIVFYSMLWGREFYAQVIERIGAARQISTGRDHVMVKHIIARDTVDEVMLQTHVCAMLMSPCVSCMPSDNEAQLCGKFHNRCRGIAQ